MAGPEPLQVSDANFEQEILKSDIPALVDFWISCSKLASLTGRGSGPAIFTILKRN